MLSLPTTARRRTRQLVDRLLASTEYAERQTNIWLDVARYADTRGGLNDGQRPISYPYRDWLISAFKHNLPYDQFVTWQLAGDKLNSGKPTREQLLATAFLKAGRQDSEGGSIDEEFRTNYVQERTELIGKDFLGLTVGCAKCHNHKYDVIDQADYYSMSAFFNQMDEHGGGGFNRGTPQGPYLLWPSAKQAEQLEAAHAKTVTREADYANALRAARAKAEAAVSASAITQLAQQVKASIDADTQAYYPFDEGYAGDLTPLMVDAQTQGPGVNPMDPDSSLQKALRKMTRPEALEFLQAKIAADVAAGKPVPNLSGVSKSGRRRAGMLADLAAMEADPGLPRLASREVEWALEQLIAAGYTDELLSDGGIIKKRGLRTWLKEGRVLWTRSGLPGGEPGFVSNVTFVPGARGKGVQMHDSVVAAAKGVGMFERTQPYTLDFWLRLRPDAPYVDSTRPEGPAANVLYSSGSVNGQGYEIGLIDGRLTYSITHNAPYEQLKISLQDEVPAGRWVHVTTTYDGQSSARGMRFYIDGKPAPIAVEHDHLTMSTKPVGPADSLFFAYYGLSSGTNFNRTELVDGALDELRVITRALTPMEVAYLQDPALVATTAENDARRQLARDPRAKRSGCGRRAGRALGRASRRADRPRLDQQANGGRRSAAISKELRAGPWRLQRLPQGSEAAGPAASISLERKAASRPSGPRPVADRSEEPAHVPRVRQPDVAGPLRHRHRPDGGGLRHAGNEPESSGAARLSGRRVHQVRLGHQAHAQADGHVGDLPAGLHHQPRESGEGSAERPARARSPFPHASRSHPRQCADGLRACC